MSRLFKRGRVWYGWFYEDGVRIQRSTRCTDKRALAAILADDLGVCAGGLQGAIARYETDVETPSPERLRAILEAVGASEVQRCRAAVGAVLTPAVLAAWVERYGGEAVADALRGYAGVVGISAAVAARPRVRTAPRGA